MKYKPVFNFQIQMDMVVNNPQVKSILKTSVLSIIRLYTCREREGGRERDRDRDGETDTERQTDRDRQTDRQRQINSDCS